MFYDDACRFRGGGGADNRVNDAIYILYASRSLKLTIDSEDRVETPGRQMCTEENSARARMDLVCRFREEDPQSGLIKSRNENVEGEVVSSCARAAVYLVSIEAADLDAYASR